MNKLIKIIRIVIIAIFLFWGTSYISIKGYKKEVKHRSFLEKTAIEAYELPAVLKYWVKTNFMKPEQAIDVEKEQNLYQIGKFPENSKVDNTLYLLYYKYLGEDKGKVFLQNIKNGDIAFSWDIPLNKIMDDLKEIDKDLIAKYYNDELSLNLTTRVRKNLPSIQISAPIMAKDSTLIFHCGTLGYLYKIDRNSKILWKSEKLVHHSIEIDSSNNIWVCSTDFTNKTANHHEYREDAILCMSQDGKEKHFFPLTTIFKKNKLFKKLIASSPNHEQEYGLDPYHLNDVLPVDSDGKYWKKGDLFLSLRHQSMIMLYRPKLDSIVWQQQGPWLGQHDINIVNDSIISVFNNNVWFFNNSGNVEPNTTSNIAFYDFFKNETSYRYNNIFISPFQGRQIDLGDGQLLIEETSKAKYFLLDSSENIIGKFFIPYFSDSARAMNPTWAKVYKKDKNNFRLQ